jgi:hypothetical protein
MAMIAHPHIRLDARGVAWIDDTNVKVIEVVLDRQENRPRLEPRRHIGSINVIAAG